jgi:formamidopyrimidine-DNA glycosylase
MPELPEVETVCRAMARHLVGKRIVGVTTSNKRLREPLPRERLRNLAGSRFVAARRRAKFLLLDLDSGPTLLVHLGMSGNLLFRPGGEKHDHAIFELDDGPPLVYSDPRRFGMILILAPDELETNPYLDRLGVEPLDDSFDVDFLRGRCKDRSRPIKSLIMDGHIVVGVGNIYASEALFRAGIRPTTPAGRIGKQRIERLVTAIKEILSAAIRQGGTTVRTYKGTGTGGRFQQQLSVYGRGDENCLVCDRPIESLVLAGRSTFYCRRCQK